jgi:hypothetical protein
MSNHFDINELTDIENTILKEDPIEAIKLLRIKYSNNRIIINKLNEYIHINHLSDKKDEWGKSIITTEEFYETDNEYMILAIAMDNAKLFERIFTHEIQQIMLKPLKLCRYVLKTLNDCIKHDAYSCIKHTMENDYMKDQLTTWLVNIGISGYWFPSISRHARIINLLFVESNVLDKMEPLDRAIIGSMFTESAICTCNTKIFKWCVFMFYKSIEHLHSEYAVQPYLNESHLKMFYMLTDTNEDDYR